MKTSLILACAGKGTRSGLKKNKLLFLSNGVPVFYKTFKAFFDSGLIDETIVTASKEDFDYIKSYLGDNAIVVLGGATRTESVKNALKLVTGDIVLIHDGARPFITKKLIKDCIDISSLNGSAIPVIPTRNTIVKRDGEFIQSYMGKDGLCSVQTPQGFLTEQIKRAYACARDNIYNDDGEIYKECFGSLSVYAGDAKNVKLTYFEDFELLDVDAQFRFGTGFDCHKLVENRDLILGGVKIPHEKGLLGHSDADALTHAIMDAILSALALRDIGFHFPDNDPNYKDANSMNLLAHVLEMVSDKGYAVQSVSATIMAEKPKLSPFIEKITENLSTALSVKREMVGIGATTLEGLGFVGREEGICVNATATLKKI